MYATLCLKMLVVTILACTLFTVLFACTLCTPGIDICCMNFLLEDSCFTMLCWFLQHNNAVNRKYIYALPQSLSPAPHPISPFQVITEHRAELPMLYSRFPLITCFTRDSVHKSLLLSQFVSASPPTAVSTNPLSTPVSLLLACQQVHR